MQVAATVAPYTPLSKRVDAAFYARGGYVYFSTREDGRVVIGGFRDVLPGMVCGGFAWSSCVIVYTAKATVHANYTCTQSCLEFWTLQM